VTSGRHAAAVMADIESGKAVGVKSTPTFFVNGKLVAGAQPLAVFSEIIDEELKK
jgi:protein-disulfide isomerase